VFVGVIQDGEARSLTSEETRAVPGLADGTVVLASDPVEVLAEAGSAKAELYRLAAERGLDPVFPAAVRSEVDAWVADPQIDDPALEDWRDRPFVTIDGATSMDLDQAVFVERDGDGHLVHYALADAAHYVRPGTALFDEALKRGASYYLPGLMVPMLPRALSEGLVSLNPEVDRRAMLFSMRLDARGVCTRTEVKRVRIRSRAKLAFEEVERFYAGRGGFGETIDANLRALAEVGKRRMALAVERNVVRYRRSEVGMTLGGHGYRFVVTSEVRRDVERYNEQMSLLCNVEGAKVLRQGEASEDVEPIYRVHPPPSRSKLAGFEEMLAALVRAHDLDPSVWLWRSDSGKPLASYLDALPEDGPHGRIADAVHRQAVMVNVRSTFEMEAGRHHGVGAEVYARFSAPMREIVGVFLHHETWQCLARERNGADPELRARVVERANESRLLQKQVTDEANRLVLDQLLEDARRDGRVLPATVMGMTRSKVYVMLDDPEVDLKVYVQHLREKRGEVTVDDAGVALRTGDRVIARLGEPVKVEVGGRDTRSDRWALDFV